MKGTAQKTGTLFKPFGGFQPLISVPAFFFTPTAIRFRIKKKFDFSPEIEIRNLYYLRKSNYGKKNT